MDLHISLDAREVLFHLNYMGYSHITREQLKSFMTDLKKLIRYETNPQPSTSTNEVQALVHGHNALTLQRLFECHTKTSMLKQREKHPAFSKDTNKENAKDNNCNNAKKLTRNKSSGDIILKSRENERKQKTNDDQVKKRPQFQRSATSEHSNKETALKSCSDPQEEPKSKMWIRPKSVQSNRPQINMKKRNDPVALYQEYQKDWERFKPNICETSRSELRWKIREKLLAQR